MKILTAFILLIFAVPLIAADSPPDEAKGFEAGLAIGHGWARLSDNIFRDLDDYALIPRVHDREGGLALQFHGGYRLLEDLAAGVVLDGWSRSSNGAHLDQLLAAAAVTWYPWRGGLFLRLGYGLGVARVAYLERGVEKTKHDIGAGYLMTAGYELPLVGEVHLAPQITITGFSTNDVEVWASHTSLTLALHFPL